MTRPIMRQRLVDTFNGLEIRQALIGEIAFVLGRKLTLSLVLPGAAFARGSAQDRFQPTRFFDLQFSQISKMRINLEAGPWLELVAYSATLSSNYIEEVDEVSVEAQRGLLVHFQLGFDKGALDVVAPAFSLTLQESISRAFPPA